MTPAGGLVELWLKIHGLCPEIKFQLIPYENTPENAREILKNLGQNIDVVAGIFDDTMLNLRNCDGFEISRQPICCIGTGAIMWTCFGMTFGKTTARFRLWILIFIVWMFSTGAKTAMMF